LARLLAFHYRPGTGVTKEMRLEPKMARLGTRAFGVGAMAILAIMLAQVDVAYPITTLPVLVMYLAAQVGFRIGLRSAEISQRKRNLLFVV
jgi:hypothetical protein